MTPTLHDTPPRPTPLRRGAPPPAMNVPTTVGWGQHPQDQASAAAISWSAGEAAPRRLNATTTTRSLFDRLAVRNEPPHEPERSATPAGIAASCTSEVRRQPTPSFASASHERANGAPQDPRRSRAPAAAFGRSAEVPDNPHWQPRRTPARAHMVPPRAGATRPHQPPTPPTGASGRERYRKTPRTQRASSPMHLAPRPHPPMA